MMQRTCGGFPINTARTTDKNLKEAAERLQCACTYGGLLVDTMGLEKTLTALLFMAYYAMIAAENRLLDQAGFKPILAVVPSGMVLHQWKASCKNFQNLVVIVAYGDKPIG